MIIFDELLTLFKIWCDPKFDILSNVNKIYSNKLYSFPCHQPFHVVMFIYVVVITIVQWKVDGFVFLPLVNFHCIRTMAYKLIIDEC
jgi:hypothetical protein